MSSTTTTQYYGLTQYIGTDKPDWTDNNEAFREVDADLHEAVQAMEGFGTDISALQEAQSALSTDVTGLEADLNTEKAKITALQNKETLQDAEIAGVKADALDMIAAVDEGTAQVATVAVSEGKYFRYNDVLYIATTNIAVGDTIVPNTNCRATNVGTELEAQAEDIAEVKSDLTVNSVSYNIKAIGSHIAGQILLANNSGQITQANTESDFGEIIPVDYRPSSDIIFPCTGTLSDDSGMAYGWLTIKTNGHVFVRMNAVPWAIASVIDYYI